ncbi:MAG: energy-coupling factor transporter transmembrane protein EcfT [Ruminococcaceae bacterium]|nr:energy-coupling factor transporter transmembrane protein EcfT [Oscillospiraceae bacterium]
MEDQELTLPAPSAGFAFASFHPAALLCYFLGVLLIAMFSLNPGIALISALGGLLFSASLQRPGVFWGSIGYLLPLSLLIAVVNPLFNYNGATPLFHLNGKPYTLESLLYGVLIAVTLIAVFCWFRCYSLILTEDKFLFLFGRILPQISLILTAALRFIPLFQKQYQKVRAAQKGMGIYSAKRFSDRFRAEIRVFSSILVWSLEHAIQTADSMKARGYGSGKRGHFGIFHFTLRDGLLIGMTVLLVAISLVAMGVGALDISFFPAIQPAPPSFLSVISYFCYSFLCFTPFVYEIKEKLKWKFFISSI